MRGRARCEYAHWFCVPRVARPWIQRGIGAAAAGAGSAAAPAAGGWPRPIPGARSTGRPPGPRRAAAPGGRSPVLLETLDDREADEPRISTGLPGVDRVLGGGLMPSTVALLAGEPGIGKSTLLLQLAAGLSAEGLSCLVASGEESRRQVSARARRLGVDGSAVSFVPGRELGSVLEAARSLRPAVLAVDSVQTLRDPAAGQAPGGTSQVRSCVDALVGLAKAEGISVLVTGHVTKVGDLAGPRTLEHAVDVVLAFEGDPRSGQRMLSAGTCRSRSSSPRRSQARSTIRPSGWRNTKSPKLKFSRMNSRSSWRSRGESLRRNPARPSRVTDARSGS